MGVSKIGFLDQKKVQNEEKKSPNSIGNWGCEKMRKKRVLALVEEMLTLFLLKIILNL